MKSYFYCYSPRLKRALLAHGFSYICTGINQKSNTIFWLCEGSEELNDYKNNYYQAERDKF